MGWVRMEPEVSGSADTVRVIAQGVSFSSSVQLDVSSIVLAFPTVTKSNFIITDINIPATTSQYAGVSGNMQAVFLQMVAGSPAVAVTYNVSTQKLTLTSAIRTNLMALVNGSPTMIQAVVPKITCSVMFIPPSLMPN